MGVAVGAGVVDDVDVGAFTAALVPVAVSSQREDRGELLDDEGSREGPRIHIHIQPLPLQVTISHHQLPYSVGKVHQVRPRSTYRIRLAKFISGKKMTKRARLMVIKAHVKRGMYFDSITLMKIARTLTSMDGVEDAAAIMATEPNLQLLAGAGLTPFEGEQVAGPSDVLLIVRAGDEEHAFVALQAAEEQLTHRPTVSSEGETGNAPKRPRSLEQAVRLHPGSKLAIISVPGPYAALEADRALRSGLHVFLFSDNVPLEDEIALKHLARERGLLLMGPDCGTAMLNGVGLGFVNVVPRGPIGIVGASGTGIQQVMSLIAQQGLGVSQVIGCGGRDLSEAVGAITTLQGLQILQDDEQTEVIVLISKPPAPSVAERVLDAATSGKKPVIVIFVGADAEALQQRYGERVIITHNLTEAARAAIQACGGESQLPRAWHPQGVSLHLGEVPAVQHVVTPLVGARQSVVSPTNTVFLSALFSGGTLCDEAMHIWEEMDLLGPIYSNIPLKPEWRLLEDQPVQGHRAIDMGADEYTRGRPHPMIDPSLRLKRMQEEANDPQVGVILLDMVLGFCSHPDPTAVYAPAIKAALAQATSSGRTLICVISLCGTEGDPQRLSVQAQSFRDAGAEVYTSNAEAALRCLQLLS
jgi:FdrA protein